MAFLVYENQPQLIEDVLRGAMEQAKFIKRQWENIWRPSFTTTDQAASEVLKLSAGLRRCISQWESAATRPGIGDLARTTLDQQGYDAVAEFNAMVAAATDVRDWIVMAWNANVAEDYVTLATDGAEVMRTLTVTELEGLVTRMDTFTATIGFVDE